MEDLLIWSKQTTIVEAKINTDVFILYTHVYICILLKSNSVYNLKNEIY